MTERKKKIVLTMSEKALVLQAVRSGESRRAILNRFKIGERCLYMIVQSANQIIDKSNDFKLKNKKSMKSAQNPELEDALMKWFIQKRDSGQPVTAMMLEEQALIFNEMLKGPETFKATGGWFRNFKKRHGLKKLSSSAKEFAEFLKEKMIREDLKLENIYNADEAGIYWKTLLNYTPALFTQKSVAGFKENEDRITALFCANANGSHKIPLLVIGKSAKPRALRNLIAGKAKLHEINYLAKLGVTYSGQKSGWMNCEIFKKWYEDEFIARVLEHQQKTRISGKVLLILDNAPSAHPPAEELNTINENFEVLFLPQNVTALIQPMDQSPISTTKKLYKTNLMRKLLIEKDYEKLETFLKDLTIKDCLVMLSKVWSSVKQTTLKNAWKALLPENMGTQKSVVNFSESAMYNENSFSCETNSSVEEFNLIHEFCGHLTKCLSKDNEDSEEISKKVKLKIEEWFNGDEGDSGYEILSDNQILQSVCNRHNNLNGLESSNMMVVDQPEYIDVKYENIEAKCENIQEKCENNQEKYENIQVKCENIQVNCKNIEEICENIQEKCENIQEQCENIQVKREIDENEKIGAQEAHESFLKFRNWMLTRVKCSESQILHFNECENILRNAIDNSQNF